MNSILKFISRNFDDAYAELSLATSEQAPPDPPDPLPPTSTEVVVVKNSRRKKAAPGLRNWTPERDAELLELHRIYNGRWRNMARNSKLGTTDDSLRNRYSRLVDGNLMLQQQQQLQPRPKPRKKLKHRNAWTREEDNAALQAAKETLLVHPRWKTVAGMLGNKRTAQAVRNRVARLEMRAQRLLVG
jgi:hypothetical protein